MLTKTILEGVCGSRAYGLHDSTSDYDVRGIFVYDPCFVLGLDYDGASKTLENKVSDTVHHEIGKFMNLAMKCNPSVLEMLYLDQYQVLTTEGRALIDLRDKFLNNAVFGSYGQYAKQQMKLFQTKEFVKPKHIVHSFRLLQQGTELLTTGKLTVAVPNRDELLAIPLLPRSEIINMFNNECEKFFAIKSCLPEEPDKDTINELLLGIRKWRYRYAV